VVTAVRRLLDTRRVGHAGTLDPFASGLLPLLVGRATRLMPFLADLHKAYTGVIRLGTRTTTDDGTGAAIGGDDSWRDLSAEGLRDAMRALTGTLDQVPPAFSAKKLGGTPAHRRARRGEAVALPPVRVVVFRFASAGREGADVAFEAEVGSGTYVRALARDLGDALGCGAHLRELRRTRVGPWAVEDAMPLADLGSGPPAVRAPGAAVAHLPERRLSAAEHELVRHGRAVPDTGAAAGPVALLADDRLVAIALPRDGSLAPKVVLEA
jgi:tRNA pseudouridine55 synthase